MLYNGTTYKSLSAAALAASRDLGLATKTVDGLAWWALKGKRTARPARKGKGLDLDLITRA